jgi:hypothetical protein
MEVEEEAELEEKKEEEEMMAMAADQHRGPRTGGSWEAGPSRPDWPGGKMITLGTIYNITGPDIAWILPGYS